MMRQIQKYLDELDELAGLIGASNSVLYRDGKAVDSIVNPESKAAIEQFIREALAK